MAEEDRATAKKQNTVYALSLTSRYHGCDKKLVPSTNPDDDTAFSRAHNR
jgi:hypothetical protein